MKLEPADTVLLAGSIRTIVGASARTPIATQEKNTKRMMMHEDSNRREFCRTLTLLLDWCDPVQPTTLCSEIFIVYLHDVHPSD
ncbi:MAG TPA: hypothetical protein VMT57_04380 [Candidatus Thermoplasmatota archaeon]|nr:hypothetical protein [Candidatus Thermoplasmatota archaeon]